MKLKAACSQNIMVYSLRDASSMSTMSCALCNAQHREQQNRSFGCRKIALNQEYGCLASDELVHAFRDGQYDEEESDVKEWTMNFRTMTLNIMVAWGFFFFFCFFCGNGIETGFWWSKAKSTKNIQGNHFNWGYNRYSHPNTCLIYLRDSWNLVARTS